jgi:RNA polymerase-binding transcription factor DksA
MDDGTWGTCVACGDEIGDARLAAVPDTATCVRCAT